VAPGPGLLWLGQLCCKAAPTTPADICDPRRPFQATIDAAEHNDHRGPPPDFRTWGQGYRRIRDPVQDKERRGEFARSAHEKLQIDEDRFTRQGTFTVGRRSGRFQFPWFARTENGGSIRASGRMEVLRAGLAGTN